MDSQRLLLLEDDETTAAFLADNLGADGFSVIIATGAGEGWRALELRRPELLVLDLSLADGSGLELLDRLRSSDALSSRVDPALPVIVVSGRASEVDRVRGLARGADDYLTKPFSYPELVARIRAVLRRADGRGARGAIRVGELAIDPFTRSVSLAGEPLQLSNKEFSLLQKLASDPTRVFLKADLLRDVWGFRVPVATRTLDAHACRLRKKLSGSPREFVITVRGIGYRLAEQL
ncbi:MAG TPA: response regulator transcription factor [Thermoleophilaceae bacterium]|jgi:DNA-binding response OmpR family regulator